MSKLAGYAVAATIVLVPIVVVAYAHLYPHFYGATSEDIATVPLGRSIAQLDKKLPCTKRKTHTLTTELRHSVVGFESATFTWDYSPNQVAGIELKSDHEKEEEEHADKKGKAHQAARSLAGKLDDFLPGVDSSGTRQWGAVSFDASREGDLSFWVEGAKNARFAEQVEAARQLLVEIAFDIPPTLSKQELADLLGTGYALADLASIDPDAPQAQSIQMLIKKFPAAIAKDQESIDIPIRHPLFTVFRLLRVQEWKSFEVTLEPRTTFADHHVAFEKCIAGRATSHESDDYLFNTQDNRGIAITIETQRVSTQPFVSGTDAKSFAAFLSALDACGAI